MRVELRMRYLERIWGDYQKAGKSEKGQILKEFCRVCGYNRKYAIRLLNSPLEGRQTKKARKGRYVYSHRTITLLEELWEVAGYPWSERFKAMIPLWMPWIRKEYVLDRKMEKELVSISARQMDRRLANKRDKIRKRR